MPGWDSYAQAVLADAPVAYYRLGEISTSVYGPNGQAFDSSQGSYDITGLNNLLVGSGVTQGTASLISTRGTSPNDTGATFPSTASKANSNIMLTPTTAATGGLQVPSATVTVEAWCQPTVFTGGSVRQVLIAYGSDASTLTAYALYHAGSSTSNHVYSFTVNIAGTAKTASTTASLVAGVTAHVVGVYDGTSARIYLNGVQIATTAATGSISYASIGAYGLALGNDGSLTDANLQGLLDEVAVYPAALTATRVLYHYTEGSKYLPANWRH
jgi:hypothetical protein